MDRAVARVRLVSMLGGDARPVLTDAEVDALLDAYAARDTDGLAPTDTGWAGEWYMNAAAAEGWRWKAAKVAGDYTFMADGAQFSKGQVLANCERMAAQYAAMDNGSVVLSDADPSAYPVRNLVL